MAEFFRIIKNEWIKLIRRRRFLVVLLLGLALVGFYTYAQYHNQQRMKQYNNPAYQKQQMQEQIDSLENRKKNDINMTEERRKQMDDSIKSFQESIKQLEQQQSDVNPVFDETKAKQDIELLKKRIADTPQEDMRTKGQLDYQLKLAEYRLDHHITTNSGKNGQTSWNAIKQFLDIGSQVFIPLLCVLLVADMVSGEQTGGTIKLLLTRPPTRGKILFAKYVTAAVGSVVVVAILLAVLYGSLFAVLGTDGGDVPTAVGLEYNKTTQMIGGKLTPTVYADPAHAEIMPMSDYIWKSLPLMLLATVAMSMLGFFCSMLVRSAAVSTGIALAVIIIGNIVVHATDGVEALKFFITPHFDLPFAWSGELSQQFAYPMSLMQSMAILAGWTVVMYIIGHVLFKKRDVLG